MARGEATGRVLEWHPGKGFQALPDSQMSGGNGLAMSADGREIYASAWAGARLVVLRRDGGTRREVPLPFLQDNIHVLADGTLLVGGQATSGWTTPAAHCSSVAGCTSRFAATSVSSSRPTRLRTSPGADRPCPLGAVAGEAGRGRADSCQQAFSRPRGAHCKYAQPQ
jgi:hypothetical protein